MSLHYIIMKLVLLRPVSPSITFTVPIGLLYLCSAVKRSDPSIEVEVIDGRLHRLEGDALLERLKSSAPDILGITSMSTEARFAHEAAAVAKKLNSAMPIIMGGAHPSSDPKGVMSDENIDCISIGEGERTLVEFVDAVKNKKDFNGIRGIVFRDNGEVIFNPPVALIENLDDLPFPDWDAIDLDEYFSLWRNSQNILQRSKHCMPVFSSRGCPHECFFCHDLFGKSFRPRSPGNVADELEVLAERYDVKEIEFSDDIFNLDIKRAKDIASEIIRRDIKLDITFPNGLRADRMDEELIDLLKEAGTYRIPYAVESATQKHQARMRKNIDLDKTLHIIDYTTRKGIISGGFFILGFPGETKQEMQATIDYAVKSRLLTASFFYLMPFPGTEISNMVPDTGNESKKLDFLDYTTISANLSDETDEVLSSMRKHAYRSFYLKPWRIFTLFKRAPKNLQFFRNIVIIIRLFISDSVMY